LALPPEIQNEKIWQFAADGLRNAAEREIALDVVCETSDDARVAGAGSTADR
jgi:hypothetical protein